MTRKPATAQMLRDAVQKRTICTPGSRVMLSSQQYLIGLRSTLGADARRKFTLRDSFLAGLAAVAEEDPFGNHVHEAIAADAKIPVLVLLKRVTPHVNRGWATPRMPGPCPKPNGGAASRTATSASPAAQTNGPELRGGGSWHRPRDRDADGVTLLVGTPIAPPCRWPGVFSGGRRAAGGKRAWCVRCGCRG